MKDREKGTDDEYEAGRNDENLYHTGIILPILRILNTIVFAEDTVIIFHIGEKGITISATEHTHFYSPI
jgi:hypothetical protein